MALLTDLFHLAEYSAQTEAWLPCDSVCRFPRKAGWEWILHSSDRKVSRKVKTTALLRYAHVLIELGVLVSTSIKETIIPKNLILTCFVSLKYQTSSEEYA